MVLDFGFVKLCITNTDLKYVYRDQFTSTLNKSNYEHMLRKSEMPTSGHWTTDAKKVFSQTGYTFIKVNKK